LKKTLRGDRKIRDYDQKILEYLNKANEPVDVENIRVACGIGHWNTALGRCLSLLLEGKIKGQKTTKGWIFWSHQKMELQPYEEAIGTFEDLKIGENEVVLTLNVNKKLNLSFPAQSPEAHILINTLKNAKTGQKVALLRTDIPTKPLIIRTRTSIPTDVEEQKPRNFTKTNHKREDPKLEQKKPAPTTNLDPTVQSWLTLRKVLMLLLKTSPSW